jgi:hypothetical protein
VVELTSDQVTVRRGLPGRAEDRRFAITPETKIEGELKRDVRVTVAFVQSGDNSEARRILVRAR